MEITLEKIELVKDRTGVSYAEAKEALEAYRDYIMKETLSDSFLYADGLPEEYSLNGHKAGISVRRLG